MGVVEYKGVRYENIKELVVLETELYLISKHGDYKIIDLKIRGGSPKLFQLRTKEKESVDVGLLQVPHACMLVGNVDIIKAKNRITVSGKLRVATGGQILYSNSDKDLKEVVRKVKEGYTKQVPGMLKRTIIRLSGHFGNITVRMVNTACETFLTGKFYRVYAGHACTVDGNVDTAMVEGKLYLKQL